MTKKGYSLVEIIVVMVILSIAIPMLIYMLGGFSAASLRSEKRTTATLLCQEKMEQIIADNINPSKGFNNIPVGTYSETMPGFPGFSRLVRVAYITKSGPVFVESATPTYYKKVIISVSNPQISDVRLETIIGAR